MRSSTPADRAEERHRKIILNASSAALAYGIQAVSSFLVVPIALDHLGTSWFGVWVTVGSFSSLLACADFGLGNGLINHVSKAMGEDDTSAAEVSVSNAFFLIIFLAVIAGILFAAASIWLDWVSFFNAPIDGHSLEIKTAVFVLVGCSLVALPFSVAQKCQIAMQQGHLGSIWMAVSSVLCFIALFAVVHFDRGLSWMVAAFYGAPVVVMAMNWTWFFLMFRPALRPRWRMATLRGALNLSRDGLMFFLLYLAGIFAYQSDAMLLSHMLGPVAAGSFSVPYRLFMILPVIAGFVIYPLWPAFGEAQARGDTAWIRSTLIRWLSVSFMAGIPVVFLLALFAEPIMRLWVGDVVSVAPSVIIGLAVWSAMSIIGGPMAMYLNGLGKIPFQVVLAWSAAVLKVFLAVLFIRWYGVAGLIWSTIFAQTICILLPSSVIVGRMVFHARPATS